MRTTNLAFGIQNSKPIPQRNDNPWNQQFHRAWKLDSAIEQWNQQHPDTKMSLETVSSKRSGGDYLVIRAEGQTPETQNRTFEKSQLKAFLKEQLMYCYQPE